MLRLRGGGWSITVLFQGKEYRVEFAGDEKMSIAKTQLMEQLHIPELHQILTCDGEVVDDGM